mgnify:CR=1 FL=1
MKRKFCAFLRRWSFQPCSGRLNHVPGYSPLVLRVNKFSTRLYFCHKANENWYHVSCQCLHGILATLWKIFIIHYFLKNKDISGSSTIWSEIFGSKNIFPTFFDQKIIIGTSERGLQVSTLISLCAQHVYHCASLHFVYTIN